MKSYKSGDRITFGKHKGQTFDHVCQFDPSYVEWMRDNQICDTDSLTRMHRGEYKHKKLPQGYAIVFD